MRPRAQDAAPARARSRAARWLRGGSWLVAAAILTLAATNRIGPPRLSPPSERHLALALGLWLPGPADPGATSWVSPRSVQAWRESAPPEHGLVESRSLEELSTRGVAAVLVSDASRLSAAELAELDRYVRAGGGVVVAGEVATRSATGEWKGTDTMAHWLGVQRLERFSAHGQDHELRAWHRQPVAAELSPDEALPLVPNHAVIGIPERDAALGWFARDDDARPGAAASLQVERGAGRIVWLAVHPRERLARTPGLASPYDGMARTLRGAIAWAARQPVIEILPWPGAAPFAARFSADENDVAPPATGPLSTARERLLEQTRRARLTASLAVLPLPASLGAGERRALRDFGEQLLRSEGAWLTDRDSLSSWTLQRSGLIAAFEQPSADRLLVYAANRSRKPMAQAVLRIHVNADFGSARVVGERSERDGQNVEIGEASHVAARVLDTTSFDLVLPVLAPSSHRSVAIELSPGKTGNAVSAAR